MAPTPVLVITDIGRDIDDTIAFLALASYQQAGVVEVVGIIATGGAEYDRARLARYWSDKLFQLPGKPKIPIAISKTQKGKPEFFQPSEAADTDTQLSEKNSYELIVALAVTHGKALNILAIAPMTCLGEVIKRVGGRGVLQRVGKILIQGQADIDPETKRLSPSKLAFNLSEDMQASEAVFTLQNQVPLYLLGKHAAYKVSLAPEDFDQWGEAAGSNVLAEQAELGISAFRRNNPKIYAKVFKDESVFRDDTPDAELDWFSKLAEISHPYDPLMVVAFLDESAKPFLDVESVGKHVLVGNTEDKPGVVNSDGLRKFLVRVVGLGCLIYKMGPASAAIQTTRCGRCRLLILPK